MNQYLLTEGKIIGGKGEQLVRLSEAGFSVPYFKIFPADASTDIEPLIRQNFNEGKYYSVRSSALGEDGTMNSYAGQFETFLNVPYHHISEKVEKVMLSAHSERIKAYQALKNIQGKISMAVVIQEMVDASVSGVMFGIHPITQAPDSLMISAVYGLGEGLVSGELNADHFSILHGEIIEQHIVSKHTQFVSDHENGGVRRSNVLDELVDKASLSIDQINELVRIGKALNDFYASPQDVEWAYKEDTLFILQSRPITGKSHKPKTKTIWDNSNIIESYPGVTTPLTFSFIREMYKVVYEQFSVLLGIRPALVKDHSDIYENMVGLIRGRVYYNLRSWYRALALLPGYKLNAEFMEGMMGVKERFELEENYKGSKGKAWWDVLRTIRKMLASLRKLPRERDRFILFLDKTVKQYQAIDFDECSPEELMHHYEHFEKILTEKWTPPLVNDFFAMIYFGVFQKLIEKWIGKDHPHLHNDLLASSNDIISTQPMLQSLKIAKHIQGNSSLRNRFQGDPRAVWDSIQGSPIGNVIQDYLLQFGERCLGELKLETISYNQAPEKYIAILQSYLNNPESLSAFDASHSAKLREKAMRVVDERINRNIFKKWVFRYVLRKTRDLVSNRENLRFERTRGFGIVRQIFSAMGRRFKQERILEHDRDIFFLAKNEIFDFLKGTAVSSEFKALVNLRKREYALYEKDSFVPERITTYGSVNPLSFPRKESINAHPEDNLKGIACCPGIVEAEVCVVHSPDEISSLKGKIMVTRSTDPGWVALFPTASGILVERGSLLSHSAIVARELGIPCIVAIDGLLSTLKTGDLVEMDGSLGHVKLLSVGE